MIEHLDPQAHAKALRDVSFDDPRTIRPAMRTLRVSIADLARAAGLDYHRTEKLVNGRAKPRPAEVAAVQRALGAVRP